MEDPPTSAHDRARLDAYKSVGLRYVEIRDEAMRLTAPELFHYTNPTGLKGILESNLLWATNVKFLNDASEVRYGHKLLREAARSLRDEKPLHNAFLRVLEEASDPFGLEFEYFVSSFCANGDLLSQWRGYAGAAGYAIGFDLSTFAFATTPVDKPLLEAGGLLKIEYEADDAIRDIQYALQFFLDALDANVLTGEPAEAEVLAAASAAMGTVMTLLLAMKDSAFSEEAEWRLVVVVDATDVLPLLQFRNTSSQLVPYIPIRLRQAENPEGLLPITRVRLGPTVRDSYAEESLDAMLKKLGYRVPVERSQIPLI